MALVIGCYGSRTVNALHIVKSLSAVSSPAIALFHGSLREKWIERSNVQLRQASTAGQGHDHSKLWSAERALSAGLLGLVPAALAFPCAPLNYALALSLTMHTHWGLEAIVVDYIRPSIFGEAIPKVSVVALYALSMAAFGSLCYFNYTDVGLAQAVRMLWTL